ncbi:L,D-transpeptidase family protein [Desulfofalx alkaliphila]|uniref:L,D-transpeptidase family protein n=1 Tax=Desulfofalx alkaliphila TaxID=105483 RepID=UPI0004E216D3|nr:peptidoglycan-binding protein [Desulfofalx alkaliphila]
MRPLLNIFAIITFVITVSATALCSPKASQAENYHHCWLDCQQNQALMLQQPYMTGPEVSILQLELFELGYYQGIIDGVYGPKTAQVVEDFQRAKNLEPTGVVDADTWNKLAEHLERPVSTENIPPPKGDLAIVVDVVNRTLTVMEDGEPYHQFHVAAGKPKTPSPVGTWHVTRKAKNWGTGFGTRWIGLNVNWGVYGIHGTNKPGSIGSYASHGCIRMHNHKVEQLYPWVEPNTPVYIVGNPFGVPGHTHRTLCRGERGSDVVVVQDYLKRHGYYQQEVDGIFGGGMEQAVLDFRADHNLPRDNQVDYEMYKAMKL